LKIGVGGIMSKPVIDAKEAVEDIRAGLDDSAFMSKYRLSAMGVQSLFRKLLDAGAMTPFEYDARIGEPSVAVDFARLPFLCQPPATDGGSKMPRRRVLALSRDASLITTIKGMLEPTGVPVTESGGVSPLNEVLAGEQPGLVIAHADDSRFSCSGIIEGVQHFDGSVPVIVVVDRQKAHMGWEAVGQGAFAFVETPLQRRIFRTMVERGLEYHELLTLKLYGKPVEETVEEAPGDITHSNDFVKGMIDSSTLVSVVMSDLDQNILFWNKGAENIFGYKAHEMIGKKITKIYPPDALTKDTVEQLRAMVSSKSGTVHGKMKQIAKDGRILTMSLALSPMVDSSGKVQGIVGIGLDVTEEVRQQQEILRLLHQVKSTQDAAIFTLAKLAESRDEETGSHLGRIREYCKAMCQGLADRESYREVVTVQFVEDLFQSSVLHDIGKVSIPDSVLLSSGTFSPEERTIMERHPIAGGKALEEAVERLGEKSFLTVGMEVAYFHHERWDGKGYPFGLKGESIPLSARIVAIADVYDALTSKRRYKKVFSHEEACNIIVQERGKRFDPVLVDVFYQLRSEFCRIKNTLFS